MALKYVGENEMAQQKVGAAAERWDFVGRSQDSGE